LVVWHIHHQALDRMARELDEHSIAAALVVSTEAAAFLLDQRSQQQQGQGGPILARILEYCGRVEAVRVVERDERRSHGEHVLSVQCVNQPVCSISPSTITVCDLRLFPALTTLELVGVAPSFLASAGLAAVKPRLRFLTFQVRVLVKCHHSIIYYNPFNQPLYIP
jgi:hypothetical protein